ncbi:MAG: phosphoribosylformylglycinamidine synthase subunit PurQ [Caldilineaceae bacterium]
MSNPTVLILHAPGTNRDGEAARAVELAGGAPTILHINQLRSGPRSFEDFDALLLPGGFSYGDALGAGARLALDLQVFFADALLAFVDSARPVLAICNGFQTLVKAGILTETGLTHLPARDGIQAPRAVTLTENARGHFECRWVHLAANPQAAAAWLHGLHDLIACPVAHGEGNVQVRDDATLAALAAQGLVAFRYVDTEGNPAGGAWKLNPNGSAGDIAGLCNAAGNVVGLMPHPEDHLLPLQNPLGGADLLGLPLFVAFVQAARQA